MRMRLAVLAALCSACALAAHGASNPDEPGTPAAGVGKVFVIPIQGAIGGDMQRTVHEILERADHAGARLVVLEIDTPGGMVNAVEEICKDLLDHRFPTAALVTGQAISGGSMTATACDEIVMVENTTIGDCEPHLLIGTVPPEMREKLESVIRARMRTNAQANDHPAPLLEAMVTKSIALYRVAYADGSREFLTKDQLDLLDSQIESGEVSRRITGRELVVKEGQLLTLTAQEALDYGLADELVQSAGAFYRGRNINESEIIREEPPPSAAEGFLERLGLQWTLVLIACLVIGIAGVIVETSTPGFGLPGIIGIIGLSAFFVILFLHDRAEVWELSLFVIGLVLVLVELFILPGIGVAGILGVLAIGASLVLSYLPSFGARGVDWSREVGGLVQVLGIGALGAIGLGALLIRVLPRMPLFGRLILLGRLRRGADLADEVQEAEAGRFPHEEAREREQPSLVGVQGETLTVLRPAGKMRTDDGRTLDVVSDGGYIPEGARVRVLDVNGPRIAVGLVTPQDTKPGAARQG